jgi:hypothetical protein
MQRCGMPVHREALPWLVWRMSAPHPTLLYSWLIHTYTVWLS